MDKQRRTKRIVVYEEGQYDSGDWPPEAMEGFFAWFQKKVDEVPAKYRDSITISIESEGGYEGSHYGRISIHYTRPETDAELADRIQSYETGMRLAEEEERRNYERLRAKYGNR